ncbi:hypothetical protein [Streptomyces sp. SID5910]|uniref:hypothetical protein n=1 Tax=Streptomyces sp. SID5910 TaxID=2690312 RepID=UPI00136A7A2F|nr:hypothetical protein [Streptomyces sp. SID5910]MYR43107.1 hypothetical protein [Streptomyces sp. SID5910]
MSRSIGIEDNEVFRVVERWTRSDGSTGVIVYGPYTALSAARGTRSRERRSPMADSSVFTIDRAPAVWEEVE